MLNAQPHPYKHEWISVTLSVKVLGLDTRKAGGFNRVQYQPDIYVKRLFNKQTTRKPLFSVI